MKTPDVGTSRRAVARKSSSGEMVLRKMVVDCFYSLRKAGINGLGQVSSPKRKGGGEREGRGRSCEKSALET